MLGALLLAAGCHHGVDSPPDKTASEVPVAGGPIDCNGELEEPSWTLHPARTGPFIGSSGMPAAPYSEARFLRDGTHLYLGLYAADEDIDSRTDHFDVELTSARGKLSLQLGPRGVVGASPPGMLVGVDTDGSIDDRGDFDEEWVVEAAIPVDALRLGADRTLAAMVSRCDQPKASGQHCGRWQGRLILAESKASP